MRKRNGVILAVIGYIVFFFCMKGWGADWKFVGKDVHGSVWEVDVASISRHHNNIVRVGVKRTPSEKGITDLVKKGGEKYKDLSHIIGIEEYDCTQKLNRILIMTNYSLGGGVILSDHYYYGEWNFINSDSIEDTILKEVCKQPK